MKNPFQYGKLTEKENFINGDEARAFLKRTFYSGINVILSSLRCWGKSGYILFSIATLLARHHQVMVVDVFIVG